MIKSNLSTIVLGEGRGEEVQEKTGGRKAEKELKAGRKKSRGRGCAVRHTERKDTWSLQKRLLQAGLGKHAPGYAPDNGLGYI